MGLRVVYDATMTLLKHHFIRYLGIGGILFGLCGLQYRTIYGLVPDGPMQAGLAWAIHFLIGSVWTHAVHRWFTFRYTAHCPYGLSLMRTFSANAVLWMASTALMGVLCDTGWMTPAIGWWVTTPLTAMANYGLMRYFTIVVP